MVDPVSQVPSVITRVLPVRKRGGTWVAIGEDEYRIPALSFGQIQELPEIMEPLTKAIVGMPTADQVGAMIRVIHMALSRNYDLTEGDLRDMLDMNNYRHVFSAVMGMSGLERKPESPQETPPGEQ